MKALTDLLTQHERDAIRAPIEQARTLPRRAFFDRDFYDYEVQHVLTESWLAISFASSIPKPGDIFPLTVLDHPILLVRGEDGLARAFHNVCPYDGCEVSIRPQKELNCITTPYHGWQYDLRGKLIAANYWDGSQDAAEILLAELNADLIPIHCKEWMSTIFIWLGDQPVPFEEQNRAVLEHLQKVDLERLTIGSNKEGEAMVETLIIQSNWKTVYENYAPNVYHESFVHAMYRRSPHSPRVDENRNKTYTEINHPSGYLGLCYDNKIGASLYGETRLAKILNKDGSPNRINTIANVFPNWVTTVLGDTARISLFLPDSPASGTQMVATFFDQDGAHDPQLLTDREQAGKAGIIARKEDNYICESIQRARQSPALNSQFYCPFWDAMHYTLSNLILDRLEAGEERQNESIAMTQAKLANGISLEYEIHGDRSNPVIFPILGITDNITDWPAGLYEPLVDAGICVIRHELRDSGYSTKFEHAGYPDLAAAKKLAGEGILPTAEYTIHDVAEDAKLLMHHLEIKSACVVGYSFGSMVAQLLALKAPEKVAGLVCLQGSNYNPELPARTAHVEKAMLAACKQYPTKNQQIEAITGLRLATNGTVHTMGIDEAKQSAQTSVERMYYPQGTARLILSRFAIEPFYEKTADILCPTLVLQGDDDPIFNKTHGNDICKRITHAELVVLKGLGHNHPLSIQPLIAEHLIRFASTVFSQV